jgi:hypothetical protein
MLPCNIVIQEHENGEIEVSAIDPVETIERAFPYTPLKSLAHEAGNRLREAIDNVHREIPERHDEALPT